MYSGGCKCPMLKVETSQQAQNGPVDVQRCYNLGLQDAVAQHIESISITLMLWMNLCCNSSSMQEMKKSQSVEKCCY